MAIRKKIMNLVLIFSLFCSTNIRCANIQKEFEQDYDALLVRMEKPNIKFSSIASNIYLCNEYQKIISLGYQAVPFIIDKMQYDKNAKVLSKALMDITKVKLEYRWDKKESKFIFPDYPDIKKGENVWVYWWKFGVKKSCIKFSNYYIQLKRIKKMKNKKEVKRIETDIKNLGIPILPCIIKEIKHGDRTLLPIASELTDGEIQKKITSKQLEKWWKKHKDEYSAPPVQKKSSKHDDR